MVVATAAVFGCSSDTNDTNDPNGQYQNQGGALWGAGGAAPYGGMPAGGFVNNGAGGVTIPVTCGNGQVDPGEACDGANLNGYTCSAASMGVTPNGQLGCTAACQFDLLPCTSNGVGGAGSGGTSGTGGANGTGGITSNGGTTGAAGSGTAGSGAGGTIGAGTDPSNLPTPSQACPNIQTGTVTFRGLAVQVWAGPASAKGGPAVLYWHGTGSNAQEAVSGLGQAAINEVQSSGGIIASFINTTGTGTNTGNNVWYTGDFDVADEIVACAIEQLGINPRRIHSAGYSAGGLQTGTMSFLRSGYLASVGVYSGGAVVTNPNQNPGHAPDIICAHGAVGSDVLILDFAQGCMTLEDSVKQRGGFAVDCNDGGGHISGSRFVGASMWQFFKDHPYGVTPKPYAGGLPGGYPAHCKVY